MCQYLRAQTWAPTLTCFLCVLSTTHPGLPNWPAHSTVLPSTPWTLAEPSRLGLKKGPGEMNRHRVCIIQLIPLNQWLCQETGSARVPRHSPTPLALTGTCTGRGGGGEGGDDWPEPRLEWRRMRATCQVLGLMSSEGAVDWDTLQQAFGVRGCWFNVFTADCINARVNHRVRHNRSGHVSVSKPQWKIHTQTTNSYSLTHLQTSHWHQHLHTQLNFYSGPILSSFVH